MSDQSDSDFLVSIPIEEKKKLENLTINYDFFADKNTSVYFEGIVECIDEAEKAIKEVAEREGKGKFIIVAVNEEYLKACRIAFPDCRVVIDSRIAPNKAILLENKVI